MVKHPDRYPQPAILPAAPAPQHDFDEELGQYWYQGVGTRHGQPAGLPDPNLDLALSELRYRATLDAMTAELLPALRSNILPFKR